jgi:hypothetical protein
MNTQDSNNFDLSILRTVQRHKEFYNRKRNFLVKVDVPLDCENMLKPEINFNDLDWDRDFDEYVESRVENGKTRSRRRIQMGLEDDYIPYYHPYFGISIHHSFFGGKVRFGGGTSYADHFISNASEWENLKYDINSKWVQMLAKGMAFCRDHGEGVLAASLRGGNGPLDMANGVMGNELFTELYDDPDNLHKVMEICYESVLSIFKLQKQNCSKIVGGHIAPIGNFWIPESCIGHISFDAACLAGPNVFDEFEKPYLNRLADETGGFIVHSHMLGKRMFKEMCSIKGMLVFAPVDDPNQPTLLDELDAVQEAVGDIPLLINIPEHRLDEALPKLAGRRAIIGLTATDPDNAKKQLEKVDKICPLLR